ncbi:putative beta-D-xylosidase 5 [Diplonema papillatum]|nr:putative beta-D-xylosidase 5 [Diplonema papillatum]
MFAVVVASMLCLGQLVQLAEAQDRPCDKGPLVGTIACDVHQTPEVRAVNIVAMLETAEKISLMDNAALSVPRLGIGAYQWWSEALHGVANSPGVNFSAPTLYATSFPQVIGTSASFNKSLWHAIGSAISTEARAFNNAGHAGLTFWTPNINLMRDPRWGRGHETPGEDPFATGIYASSFVPGMQEGEDPHYVKAATCCKHYYGYDMEASGNKTRHDFDALISVQDEADSYLPAFHSCVYNGKSLGIMCSYNAVNGVPSCANARIMNGIARGQWNFSGYITSDCGAVSDVFANHQYTSAYQTVTDVLQAGMDTDCGNYVGHFLPYALQNGTTPIDAVDDALVHLFEVQIRLGMFDPAQNQSYLNLTWASNVNTPAHQQLALEAAQQSVVLLKNSGGVFPLSKSEVQSLAVIGPNANATSVMQANYYGVAPYLVSPLEGLSKYVPTTYVEGCNVQCVNANGFTAAAAAAAAADAVVLVVGLSTAIEAEGLDRTSIDLPGQQKQLIQQVAAAAKGPVLCVVMAGGSVDFSVARNLDAVQGIMWVGYPGQSGGDAIAQAVFGDINPSGRLPHTQYVGKYIDNLSMLDMSWRPNSTSNNLGRSYRFFPGPVLYTYGAGLSYTTFSYTQPESQADGSMNQSTTAINAAIAKAESRFEYSPSADTPALFTLNATVANSGTRAGAVTVIVYAVPPPQRPEYGYPIKFNVGFEKVTLSPGQSVEVSFPLPVHAISVINLAGVRIPVTGTWQYMIGDELVANVTAQ